MRGLIIIIAAILFAGTVRGQETTVNEITPVEEERSYYVHQSLLPYVSTFVAAMKADGWDFSNVQDNDVFILFDYELGQQGLDRMEGKAGLAYGMNDDEVVYVIIRAEAWLTLEDYEKQDLINHELMHDIFNVRHTTEGDYNELMDTKTFARSWAETFYRLVSAIGDLNESIQ